MKKSWWMHCEWDRSVFLPVRSKLTPRHNRFNRDSWLSVCPACWSPLSGHLSLEGLAQLVPGWCQASCAMPTKLWLGWRDCCYLQREPLIGNRHCGKGFSGGIMQHRKETFTGREAYENVLGGWGQLMWVMLIIASSLHPTVSLVSIHHPLPPSCQGISGYNGESCFWSYYLCKSNMPYDGGEVWLAFPEGVQSTAEGSGQMCVILSAESS